tara:strand:- start:517 stop:645 length:129 start_codon:yes stop_codon:yes gene_type:complete
MGIISLHNKDLKKVVLKTRALAQKKKLQVFKNGLNDMYKKGD